MPAIALMPRAAARRLLLVLPLALVACDTPAVAPEGTLTMEETIAALRALQQVAAPAPRTSDVAAGGMQASVVAAGSPITFSTTCPGGGTYQINGTNGGWSSAPEANTSPMYELREQFTKCTVSADGRSYTFDSDPELRTRMGLRMVTSEGKSSRCAVSFLSTRNIDVPDSAGKSEGQLCGRDVNAAEAGITLGPVSLIGR
jgi:hypothetical protein